MPNGYEIFKTSTLCLLNTWDKAAVCRCLLPWMHLRDAGTAFELSDMAIRGSQPFLTHWFEMPPPERLFVPRFLCAHGNKSTMMKDAKSKMHVQSKPRLQGFVKIKKFCNQNISVTFSMVLKCFWISVAVTLLFVFSWPLDSKWDVTCLILRPKWAVLIESYLRNILESVPKAVTCILTKNLCVM